MTTLFSDDFNRANGSPGSNWGSGGSIASNQLSVSSSGGAILTTTSAHADVADVRVTVKITGSSNDGGPCVRAPSANGGDTCYYADCYVGGADLYRRVGASDTFLGNFTTLALNDTFGLESSGTGATVTLKGYKNGTLAGTITDSSASRLTTAARTGIFNWNGGSTYDDFLVEDLSTGNSAALTGQAGTGARGTLAPSTAAALSGLAGTSAIGTLSPNQGATAALSGVSASSALGTLSAGTAAGLNGQAATSAQGTLVASLSFSLTGQAAHSGAGESFPRHRGHPSRAVGKRRCGRAPAAWRGGCDRGAGDRRNRLARVLDDGGALGGHGVRAAGAR
jgi:hypothetical protein